MILDISQENKYTETEKEVIDYLMNHLNLLEELSINDLAKKTYTGSLTVVSIFSLTKSLKTLIISMLLSFFVVKFVKFKVGICRIVLYNSCRR